MIGAPNKTMDGLSLALVAIVVLGLLPGFPQASETDKFETDKKADVVRAFVGAFNGQDVAAMAALVTTDIRWVYVNRTALAVELEGKEALIKSMTEYSAAARLAGLKFTAWSAAGSA